MALRLLWGVVLRLLRPPKDSPAESTAGPEPVDPLGGLVTATLAGDTRAERTLLVTLGPSLLCAVRGVLGGSHPELEDVLQDAMAALHRALPGFRGQCRVVHFASRVAVQTALSARRRAGYRSRLTPPLSPADLAELACDERSPADARASAERLATFRALLAELPDAQAEALVLHLVLGYSVDETASTQRVPLNTARSRLRKGIVRLRERVQGDPNLLAILEPEA